MATKRKQYPSQARLRELFEVCEDGNLVWKWRNDRSEAWNKTWSGEIIGKVNVNHDATIKREVKIDGVQYSAVDIAWIFFYADIPDGNRIRLYDKFSGIFKENLRSENTNGKRTYHSGISVGKSKSSKYIGVSKSYNGFYVAQARVNGKRVSIGTFRIEDAAAAAYDEYVTRTYGNHWGCNGVEFDDFEKYRVRKKEKQTRQMSSSSGYKGVYKKRKKWQSKIQCGGKSNQINLGTFETKEEAARAYNIAAYEHYGDHAVLNDIPDPLGKLQADEEDVF